MPNDRTPLKFDLSDLLARARRAVGSRVGPVTINLPFLDIAVHPKSREKQVAREVVIRLQDRRVLSAGECCDSCVREAVSSLQEIRKTLVDKQVELSDLQDGSLYLLIELMLSSIRQFLTFEQRLRDMGEAVPNRMPQGERIRPGDDYYDALETLRGHLLRCLVQVSAIASIDPPKNQMVGRYQTPWQLDAYVDPALVDKVETKR